MTTQEWRHEGFLPYGMPGGYCSQPVASGDTLILSPNLGPTVNSSDSEYNASISGDDGLELYFGSDRPGGHGKVDTYVTRRATRTDPWGPPTNLGPKVNRSSDNAIPSVSPDGLELYFMSNHPASGFGSTSLFDLFASKRASANDPWGEPVNLGPSVNSDAIDQGPCLSADELTLVFSSNRDGGQGRTDLWMCRRASPGEPFAAPVNLGPTVNFTTADDRPCLSADGLMLIFESIGPRPGGMGHGDLWSCSRASPSESFGEPSNMGAPLNSGAIEGDPALSADGLTLVFRRRGRGYGPDLWMNTRRSVNEFFDVPFDLGPTINTDYYEGGPALSSDGTMLLFGSGRPGGVGRHDLWMAKTKNEKDRHH